MSKLKGELSYKDWCILKHALQEKVSINEDILSEFDYISYKSDEEFDESDVYTLEHFDRDKFLKELSEERATLDRVAEMIEGFKEYINK